MSLPGPSLHEVYTEEDEYNEHDDTIQLQEFLSELGMEKYYSVFEQHEIGFRAMLDLSDADIRKLFV